MVTLSQASLPLPFFQQHMLSVPRFGNSHSILDFFIIPILVVICEVAIVIVYGHH